MKFKVGTREFEIPDAEVTAAIEKKETVMTLVEDVIVRTPEEETKFVENRKKEARKEGLEIAIKNYREANELEFEGKNIEALVGAVVAKNKEESGQEESVVVKNLQKKIELKDKALEIANGKITEVEGSIAKIKADTKIDKALDQFIPDNTLLPKEDIKTILKTKMEFNLDETGNIVVSEGGVVKTVKETGDNMLPKAAIEDFFRTNNHYMKAPGKGAGGDDSKQNEDGKLTVEKFNEQMTEKGHVINSPEYTAELNKHIADKTIEI